MRAVDSLERLQEYLNRDRDQSPDEEARNAMVEAVGHLQQAIETPGWQEWIRYGMSVPIHAPSIPEEIRTAWSESRGKDVEWIDAGSLRILAERNAPGTTVESLVASGVTAVDDKVAQADAEDLKADTTRSEKRQKSDTGLAAAARVPPKVSIRKRRVTKSDQIDAKLAQAALNAQLANEEQARAHLPRPLNDQIDVKTRSHKINYVAHAIRSSHQTDRFVIFGDVSEIGLLTEVLELMNIDS